MNLFELLSTGLRRTPEREALETDADGEAGWTFGRLFERSRRLAAGLEARGLRRGDRVAFFLGNRAELVIAYLALVELGVAMVPVNLAYRRREIGHILSDARPRYVLTEASHRHHLAEVDAAAASSVEEVLLAEELESLDLDPGDRSVTAVTEEDMAFVMYTSGTTGRSKGAVLTHGNVAATVQALLDAWAWSADDRLLLALPLFHVHGLIVGLHCALAAGARVRLLSGFDAERVVDELSVGPARGDRPTLFFGVPTMYGRLVRRLEALETPPDLSGMRLFCSGSAPLDPETFRRFGTLTGHAILERYGMTETGMLLSNPYRGERRPGTVGTPLPGVSARIVDENGVDLEDGGEGELLVHGANVFNGYWERPEAEETSFSTDREGRRWFHTGDLARRDPETGYYTLLGRSHDLILSGGYNIYPREIEEVLTAHPAVREAAVVGRAHPEWGETPMAYLVVDAPIKEEALIEHCKRQIASFKVPRHYAFVDALPRNALGKVQKHLLARLET